MLKNEQGRKRKRSRKKQGIKKRVRESKNRKLEGRKERKKDACSALR